LGANDVWSELTTDRVIRYARLAPGHYEFQVSAVNGDDIASPAPASVSFSVLPAYWQTWWFRTLAVLAVVLVLVAIARIRLHWLESERLRLEALVATHTCKLTEQNERLAREVADRLAVEGALRESEQRVRDIIEHSTNLFFAHTVDHELIYASPQSRTFLDCEPEEMLKRWTDFVTDNPVNQIGFQATQRALETGVKQQPYQLELRGLTGRLIWVEVNEAPVVRDGVTVAMVGSLTDITEAKRAAEARERLETQLRQAQKMEAVGRLAGGIAHDFNNLLTVIVGNAQLMGETIDDQHPLAEELAETRRAADRAAGLVAQLLAFSRKQLVKPATLDLNAVVSDAARMLRRLIGADIDLILDLAQPAPLIEADRTQLDQVLINLAVNAREAMHDGGTLTISTNVVTLDGAIPEEGGDEIPAGCYVVLTIADNGVGMDAETRSHVFEPFFTTRDVGKGTGLGLATVYGVVKQSGGAIRLESEPDSGTTFRIYLPPALADCADSMVTKGVTDLADRRSGEDRVVLVVEDEHGVRDYVCRTLRRIGYRVLSASDGATALAISDEHSEVIHLLLTDMIMPGMNGKIVADQIVARRPDTRVLYMSGYTRDALGERGVCDPSTRFLQKPFTPSDLAMQVERALA
jgi:PAS domain S-box-containing protein